MNVKTYVFLVKNQQGVQQTRRIVAYKILTLPLVAYVHPIQFALKRSLTVSILLLPNYLWDK